MGISKLVVSAASKFIQESIKRDKVVMFSKTYCQFCKRTKTRLDKIKVPYLAIEIENLEECQNIQDILKEMTGARSVPRVFVNQKFLGDANKIKAMSESGELLEYFKKEGILI